jgi:hypothetical protein
MPSAKVTAQTISSLIMAMVADVAMVVGAVWGYFATETRPAPSSYPHLPPELRTV